MNSHELLSEIATILAENFTPVKLIIEGKIRGSFEGDLIIFSDNQFGLNNIKGDTKNHFEFDEDSFKSIYVEDTFGSKSEVTITIEV